MKKIFGLIACVVFSFCSMNVFAETISFTAGSETISIDSGDYPTDIFNIVKMNQSGIQKSINQTGVTKAELTTAISKVKDVYNNEIAGRFKSSQPVTDVIKGMNDETEEIAKTLPSTQMLQNVWAPAYIGKLISAPPHFGLGVNAGVAKLNISPLLDVCKVFDIDAGSIPSTFIFPTLTADLRLGGVILPFDLGVAFSTIDTSAIGLKDAIKPVTFDYFALAFDLRYCVYNGAGFLPKVSVSAGYYYTNGNIKVDDNNASASLDFKSSTFMLAAQASTKLVFFVPFVGARLAFAKTDVNWDATANWSNILGVNNSAFTTALNNGLMPTKFSGGNDNFSVHPMFFGGFAFDLAVIDLTFSVAFDCNGSIPAGAFSLRFSL